MTDLEAIVTWVAGSYAILTSSLLLGYARSGWGAWSEADGVTPLAGTASFPQLRAAA
jgi:hypothetical protein